MLRAPGMARCLQTHVGAQSHALSTQAEYNKMTMNNRQTQTPCGCSSQARPVLSVRASRYMRPHGIDVLATGRAELDVEPSACRVARRRCPVEVGMLQDLGLSTPAADATS